MKDQAHVFNTANVLNNEEELYLKEQMQRNDVISNFSLESNKNEGKDFFSRRTNSEDNTSGRVNFVRTGMNEKDLVKYTVMLEKLVVPNMSIKTDLSQNGDNHIIQESKSSSKDLVESYQKMRSEEPLEKDQSIILDDEPRRCCPTCSEIKEEIKSLFTSFNKNYVFLMLLELIRKNFLSISGVFHGP